MSCSSEEDQARYRVRLNVAAEKIMVEVMGRRNGTSLTRDQIADVIAQFFDHETRLRRGRM